MLLVFAAIIACPPHANQTHDAARNEIGGGVQKIKLILAGRELRSIATAYQARNRLADLEGEHRAHRTREHVIHKLLVLQEKVDQHLKDGLAFVHRRRLCSLLLCYALHKIRAQAIDIKREIGRFIRKVLIERRAANHCPIAQHRNGNVFKPMLFEQFGESGEQCPIGFLHTKIHKVKPFKNAYGPIMHVR